MEASPRPGQRIGRYVIEATLGSGGMGQVYRAYDELLRRRVALKLLHVRDVAASDERAHEALERILREARMAAALDHPNVVSIFDVGDHEGVAFIVMEFVLGQSLRALIAADMPVETRVHWLADAARALRAAHRAGLVHRDIKPENVMVRSDGVVKVLDFGIAREAIDLVKRTSHPDGVVAIQDLPDALRATVSSTVENGAMVGTPGYMPPELMLRGVFDARGDQFAWAVMAYELLASRMPWTRGDDAAAYIAGALFDPAPPLLGVCPDAPPGFAAAVDRALSKDPAERFESMDALLEAMGAAASMTIAPPAIPLSADDVPFAPTAASGPLIDSVRESRGAPATIGTAPPAVTQRQSPPPARSNRGTAIVAGVAVIALGLTGGAAYVVRQRARARNARASSAVHIVSITHEQRLTFDDGCEEFPTFSPDGRGVLFDAADGEDYHLFVLDVASGQRRRVTSEHGWQYASSLSPDGRSAAYVSRETAGVFLNVTSIDGGTPPRRLHEGDVRPTWSRDGRCVWGGGRESASCFDRNSGAPLRTLPAPAGEQITYVLELPDGRFAVRTAAQGVRTTSRLRLYSAAGRNERLLGDEDIDEAVALTPSGHSVLVAQSRTDLHTRLVELPIDGHGARSTPNDVARPTKGLQFSPRGDRIVWSDCASRSSHGRLVRGAETGMQFEQTSPIRDWTDAFFGTVPGTNELAVISDRRGRLEAWLMDPASRRQARVIEGLQDVTSIAVSADGRTVAASIGAVGIFVAAIDGSTPPRQITHHPLDRFPAFSRDGTRIYFERHDEFPRPRVAAITLATGAIEYVLGLDTGRPSTSRAANLLGYVSLEGDAETGTPRIRDLDTGADRPLSADIQPGTFLPIVFANDGIRAAVTDNARSAIEIDLASGRVTGRYDAGGDQVTGIALTDDALLVTRTAWSGDLWIGDVGTR